MANDNTKEEFWLMLHARTDDAVLLSDTGDRDDAVWLPLSQIEVEGDMPDINDMAEFHIPVWLAKKEGLI